MSTTVCSRRTEIPAGYFLAECAVSGGTLRDYLRSALRAADGNLCVELRPVYIDFPLPCPSGVGTALTPAELHALHHQEPCCFSTALCTQYFTCLQDGQVHVVLFDSTESLRAKYQTLLELNVPMVLIEDPALRARL